MSQMGIQASIAEIGVEKPKSRVQFWVIALVGAVSFAAIGHLLIKYGLLQLSHLALHTSTSSRLLTYLTNPVVLTGLIIYGLGTLMWVFAVSRKEISYLYPLTALNYALIALGGKILFGEVISIARWFGIAVVMFGVILMQRSGSKEPK
jgi:drug/metabolite transporter (DMT)-like permease